MFRPFTITLVQSIAGIRNCVAAPHPCSMSSGFPGGSSTIYALATGGIRCALAVIRVSGPNTSQVLHKIGRFPSSKRLPEPRMATLRKLHDPLSNNIIDHGLVLWFPGPRSFTGEDSCEFHVHGGPAVITSVLRAIGNVPGCRLAEPGEFSKRAFLNGKMDLTAVEGLGDLISAETEMQRAQALNQMGGSLGSLYESWRDRIAKSLAHAEAFIDFGEDENIESDILEKVAREIGALLAEMNSHLKDHRKGERLRNGVRIAILGRPNVGKSSLLNIFSKRDMAIVSKIPGTTRDILEACLDLQGYPVVFCDTAGIRHASCDEIELEGIRRAVQEAHRADVVLLVMSYLDISKKLSSPHLHNDGHPAPACDLDKAQLVQEEFAQLLLPHHNKTGTAELQLHAEIYEKVVLVGNKVDLASEEGIGLQRVQRLKNACDGWISCKTLSGMETFTELLAARVAQMCTDPKFESPCLTRERYRSHLQNCVHHLTLYLNPGHQQDLALQTHSLKEAMNSIGFITGHLGTEDILDIIFREFCIGK